MVGSIPRPVDDQRADDAAPILDDDPPATVRLAFVWLTAAAGVMLLLPRQVVSAGICFALSVGTFVAHRVLLRRYERAALPTKGKPAASAPPEGAASVDSPEPPASSG